MTLESELFGRLSTYTDLIALVGTRIHPVQAPQNVLRPYVVFRRIGAERESAFGGDIGLVKARYQINSFAEDYRSARDVARQVKAALQRWNNPDGDPEILDAFIEEDVDDFEPEINLYYAMLEAGIWHRE